jgi:hypothetical protein
MRPGLLTLLIALALTACTDSAGSRRESGAPPRPAATLTMLDGVEPATRARESRPCAGGVQRQLVGMRHTIIGHSFTWPEPLRFPPLPDRHNKILWELRGTGHSADSADLRITASLNGSQMVVQRRVDGHVTPGPFRPSIIDLPKPGCWTFSLAWGAVRDTVSVRYRRSDWGRP